MKCLVTGAAGFIGSHLCERLLQAGHRVVGLDAFVRSYPRAIKEANLAAARAHRQFRLHDLDLRSDPIEDVMRDAEAIIHLAAMPGLPKSWTDFDLYESCNVIGTQRLLKAASQSRRLQRFVYTSTSSVYGRFANGDEAIPTRPISPYGVTKLAAEQLCRAYMEEKNLPVTVLRLFSVYGPRQRPDMGYFKFIQALLAGTPISVCGDGQQVRGNTYVGDCVEAIMLSLQALPGETYNVGGGETASVWDILRKLEVLTGRRARVVQEPARLGDQRSTCADTSKLARQLGWRPRIGLEEGLAMQIAWQQGARQHEPVRRKSEFVAA
ncbi:MAG TPA: NAD-dependent epimerase/dehydratase family protein [Gemmataceae bacterium]|nr:NAD-dependent epimerase/dehydratase family protein [Gemmataceae bacterium]